MASDREVLPFLPRIFCTNPLVFNYKIETLRGGFGDAKPTGQFLLFRRTPSASCFGTRRWTDSKAGQPFKTGC